MRFFHAIYYCFLGKFSFFTFDKESVLHFPCLMVLRSEQCIKNPEGCFYQGSRHFFEAKIEPYSFCLLNCLIDKVFFPCINAGHWRLDVILSEFFAARPCFYDFWSHFFNETKIYFLPFKGLS